MEIHTLSSITGSSQGRFVGLCAVMALGLAASTHAADLWWDGGAADIATAGDGASAGGGGTWNSSFKNWDAGNGIAHVAWNNANGDNAIFGGATASTVTLANAVTVNGLSIINTNSNYTLSGSGITLGGGAPVITVTRNGTISSKVSGAGGLTKGGSATLTLNGSVANDFTGGLKVQFGTVTLNFANMATPTDLIGSGNAVILNSGLFGVTAKTSGVTSQSVNGLVLNGGSSAGVSFTSTASASSALNLGSITRNANAVVNFTLPVSGSITTTAVNNPNGLLGTWANTGSSASLKYATVSGGVVSALTGTPAVDGSELVDTTGVANYDLAAGGGTVPASVSANTIRYAGGAGTTAPGSSLFSVNGLMNAGSGLWTIGTNEVAIGADRELVIHTGTSGITVSGVIKDGGGKSALTITGTGPLGLNALNTYSGTTTINGPWAYADNGSTVTIAGPLKNSGTSNPSEFGKGDTIVLHGAVIQITASNATGTSDRNFTLTGTSGFYLKNVMTQTLTGSISGSGNLSMDSDFVGSTSPGKANLVLAGNNSFTGDVVFQNDSRITLAHANALTNATLNLAGTRILADLSSNNLAYVIGGLKGSVNLNLGTGLAGGGNGMVTIGGNHQSTSYTGVLSGGAGLVKTGNGTLTLSPATPNSYGGDTRVEAGVLAVNGSALPDTTKLVINAGKVAASGIETVDTLYFGTIQQAAGTWGATGSGADHIDDTHFSGTAGVIKVQPWSVNAAQLNFGQVTNGDTIEMAVTITNLGTSTIQGTAGVTSPRYAVTGGANWTVAANSTTTITVSFSPTQSGIVTDTLTLSSAGLTRTVSLSGEGISFVQPVATQFQDYAFGCLSGMAAPASSASINLNEGSSITQSFQPRRDGFLGEFAARDSSAAAVTCTLKKLTVKTLAYQSSPSTVRFEILRIETNGSRTVLATQDLIQQLFGSTPYSVTFASPPVLDFNATYELKVTLVTCGTRSYGGGPSIQLFRPAAAYVDGELTSGGDLWFDNTSTATIPVFPQLVITADAANRFFYDGDIANANSSSYDTLKGKFLGIGGAAEKLVFSHPSAWGPLSFSVENTSFATSSVSSRSGAADTCQFSGVAEGGTMLWVKAGNSVVGCVKLMTFPQRGMSLSYSYVQYPGEIDHSLKHASAEIMAYISSVYARANVTIQWTDNGILTHEWDANGDGSSFDDTYAEQWSPITAGVIPNQTSYFSNVYMLRFNKDDTFVGGTNGGGTSLGSGPGESVRGALVRCHLFRPASQFASTLAHEVGHNLGLSHTSIDNNLMTVGRDADGLWAPQWTIIHNTLKTLPPPVINPDGNGNGILDSWETQMFGGSAAGANPATGDPDNDGLDNLLEYALGTNPLQATVNPLTGGLATIGADRYLRISVPKNPVAANLIFAAEVSGDISGWSGAGVVEEENSSTRYTARDNVPSSSASTRFIRLKVTVKP